MVQFAPLVPPRERVTWSLEDYGDQLSVISEDLLCLDTREELTEAQDTLVDISIDLNEDLEDGSMSDSTDAQQLADKVQDLIDVSQSLLSVKCQTLADQESLVGYDYDF